MTFDDNFNRSPFPGRFIDYAMGKIERGQYEPKPQEQHQVGGCGDPACAQCNPETASAIARGEMTNTGRTVATGGYVRGATVGAVGDMAAVMRAAAERMGVNVGGGSAAGDDLDDARAKVEDWIVEMKGTEQSFSDIVGNAEALDQLRDAVRAPVEHAELYAAYGMSMPKGALLSGPPGCGKTMFARAAAAEMSRLYDGADVEMISLSGTTIQSPYIGVTEGHIKAIFDYARLYSEDRGHPLLVFIDEAEVLFPDRTGRVRRVAPWEESQVAAFLAEMDGLRPSGAFVLLATNRPEVMDQAVLRDGRCDFKIKVARPDRDAAAVILDRAFEGVPVAAEFDKAMLVFAALESLLDPHRVVLDFRELIQGAEDRFEAAGFKTELSDEGKRLKQHNFLLEHIISGAMCVSIPRRSVRYAFARDKASGQVGGVRVEDVLAAVADVYAENRKLDHSFALNEFREALLAEAEASR